MSVEPAAAEASDHAPAAHLGLSGKLLVLTILFVMIAEVLIYVPSVANFRENWLRDRLSAAYTAALVFETVPEGAVLDTAVRQRILQRIRAHAVALKTGERRLLLAASDLPVVNHDIDMRNLPWYRSIIDAFDTLACADKDILRVVGDAPMGAEYVEIVID